MTKNLLLLTIKDYYFIGCLVVLGFVFWACSYFFSSDADSFIIKSYEKGVKVEQSVSLASDKSFKIWGKEGEMVVEVAAEKGIRIASSTCKCQICVNSGWSKSETLICVPNEVAIIPDKKSNGSDTVDAVTR